jgi:hypothetical protein
LKPLIFTQVKLHFLKLKKGNTVTDLLEAAVNVLCCGEVFAEEEMVICCCVEGEGCFAFFVAFQKGTKFRELPLCFELFIPLSPEFRDG